MAGGTRGREGRELSQETLSQMKPWQEFSKQMQTDNAGLRRGTVDSGKL
jgi:hypothetical protein